MAPPQSAQLLSQMEALEGELCALFAARVAPGEASLERVRVQLRDTAESLLFSDYSAAQARPVAHVWRPLARLTRAQAHEVEALLWKGVFYRFIEDYRRRIRKYSAAAAAKEPGAQESLKKARRLAGGVALSNVAPDCQTGAALRLWTASAPSSATACRTTRA